MFVKNQDSHMPRSSTNATESKAELRSEENDEVYEGLLEAQGTESYREPSPNKHRTRWLLYIVLATSLALNIWNALPHRLRPHQVFENGKPLAILANRSRISRKEGFYSPEWDPRKNDVAQVDALWNSTDDNFGIIALDRQWALGHGLKPSREWPLDASKNIYGFAVFHAMHCLRYLRVEMMLFSNSDYTPKEAKWSHTLHCFDVIRQELMCGATDTLQAGTLDHHTGFGETRECADWEYLRDWAGERSSGYVLLEDTTSAIFTEDRPTIDGWYFPPSS